MKTLQSKFSLLMVLALIGLFALPGMVMADDDDMENIDEVDEIEYINHALKQYRKLTFNAKATSLAAISQIAESDMDDKDKAKYMEELLEKVKSQGIRNAMRLALLEIYRDEDKKKYKAHLTALLLENDKLVLEMGMDDDEDDDDEKDEHDHDHDEEEE